ncbi:hypothetical protein D3C79_727410 [compost metagenome]
MRQATLAQLAQPTGRGLPLGHQFTRILVAQLTEVELTAFGNAECFAQQVGRIKLGQLLQRTQVTLAIGEEKPTCLGDAAMLADSGHAILQGPPAAYVHVYITAGHGANAQLPSQAAQPGQAGLVIAAPMQVHTQPQAFAEQGMQPLAGDQVAGVLGKP